MTIKHTPGPWSVREDEFGLLIIMEQLAGKDEYLAIYASPNPEQRLADARLIAAAPKLLEAAKEALDILEGIHITYHVPEHLWDKLKAAIAKAEGLEAK